MDGGLSEWRSGVRERLRLATSRKHFYQRDDQSQLHAPALVRGRSIRGASAVTPHAHRGTLMEKRVNNLMLLALAFASGAFCISVAEAADDSNAMTQTAPDAQTQVLDSMSRW